MNNVARVLKVVTAKTVFWVVAGSVTIAKCAKSGKFVKRDNAQWLLDNMASLAVPAEKVAQLNRGTYSDACSFRSEFVQAVEFFAVTVFCGRTNNKLLNPLRAIAFNAWA